MNFLALIESKRDGKALSPEEVKQLVQGYTAGAVPDYQMAALLMAIYFQGLTDAETGALTLAMRDSGQNLQFPPDARPLVDKHSTGGVGDKVSLPLAPLLAALGFRVPMISGRALGITGGTLDKLESIPGFTALLAPEAITTQVQETGCVICGQTDEMVPADKRLYALRDVTGTVPSIPLITASILAKKLAESISALILDVKFGSGAFMGSRKQAAQLARAMVRLGSQCGINMRAMLTAMDTPLGRSAGNWLEVKESVQLLAGHGPADLEQLVVECAAQLLDQAGKASSVEEGRAKARACLADGSARKKWLEMLAAQGADLERMDHLLKSDSLAASVHELPAQRDGFVTRCDARVVGEVIRELGGGRIHKESCIRPEVGVDCLAKPGEYRRAGELLCRLHGPKEMTAGARERLRAAFEWSDSPTQDPQPLIAEVI